MHRIAPIQDRFHSFTAIFSAYYVPTSMVLPTYKPEPKTVLFSPHPQRGHYFGWTEWYEWVAHGGIVKIMMGPDTPPRHSFISIYHERLGYTIICLCTTIISHLAWLHSWYVHAPVNYPKSAAASWWYFWFTAISWTVSDGISWNTNFLVVCANPYYRTEVRLELSVWRLSRGFGKCGTGKLAYLYYN